MSKNFVDVKDVKVSAVVVSYNRRELLEQTLDGIQSGATKPENVIVVDNASTDSTAEFLEKYVKNAAVKIDVVSLSENTGGAGGFTVGIAEAMKHDVDLLWLMDDDTIPGEKTLHELIRVWFEYSAIPEGRPAFVASKVVWKDGREHPMNTPRQRPQVAPSAIEAAKKVQAMQVRSASFVSLLVDVKDVRKAGLPVAAYFLWSDDFEYTTRLAKHGVGLFAPTSEVLHLTKKFGSTDADPGERFTWEVRNKIWMFKHSASLSPAEKVLYGGSSVVRWGKTIVKSKQPRALLRYLAQGAKEALSSPPADNSDVLAPVYDIAEAHAQENQPPEAQIDARFSVLLPVYVQDKAEYFVRAFGSITREQTVKPDEVVLVQDGPVGEELSTTLKACFDSSDIPVKHVILKENVGLAEALDQGLTECSYEIVARMDADDISLPTRFEQQIPYILDGADIVGSSLLEFSGSENHIVAERIVSASQEEIEHQARFSSPFNHPTIVYRKSKVAQAGGYRKLNLLEDYWLWARMIEAGAHVANVVEPLLLYRVSDGAYKRRGGLGVFASEINLQNHLLSEGFIKPTQWARNIAIRGGYRFIPEKVRQKLYRSTLANKHKKE